MAEQEKIPGLTSFEAEAVPCPPGTPATPRPPGREREPAAEPGVTEVLVRLRGTDDLLHRAQEVLRQHGLAVEVVPAGSQPG